MKIVDIKDTETVEEYIEAVEEYIERTYTPPPDLYFIAAKLPKSGLDGSVKEEGNEEKG